jgi:myo-inositol 2-dehydrogenase / D-chiro-inositol 1-dehydrogenase
MPDLRVAVIGVGMMGADHVARIQSRIAGARVAVINDFLADKAQALAETIPACRSVDDPAEAIADPDVDAVVLATPSPTHAGLLEACLQHNKPVLCEKPLTTDSRTSLEIVEHEAKLGRRLIQVGFMRRFDHEYVQLKKLIDDGTLGKPLLVHCVHRNPSVAEGFDSASVVRDALVHEVDIARYLLDEEISTIQMIKPAPNPSGPAGLDDPMIAIFRTASGRHVDVELFINTNIAYQVRTEVVAERGTATIGLGVGLMQTAAPGIWCGQITADFRDRFGQAYDTEFQRWVRAVHSGDPAKVYTDGPTAWDGYAAAAACEAAIASLDSGRPETVELADRASFPGA